MNWLKVFNRSLKLTISVLSLTCIAVSTNAEFHTGDLVFQVEGDSEFSNAIAMATASTDSLKIIHVGIIEITDDKGVMVIEASPEEGVREISLERFLNESPKINGMPGALVKRLSVPFNSEETIAKAKSHIGESYDWWYLPDNGKMYCSELVAESFITPDGETIFLSTPMNFRAPDGTMPEFWIKLFSQLGENVPEGVEGTNPADIAKDSSLFEISRFF